MATNSSIGIYDRKTNTSTFIYCHNDGYLEHVGLMLLLYYNSPEKAQALIDLGDLSALYPNMAPLIGEESKHNFDHPIPNVTVAYHRDRAEDFHQTKFQTDNARTISAQLYMPYLYLYKNNEWYYSTTGTRWNKLKNNSIIKALLPQKG